MRVPLNVVTNDRYGGVNRFEFGTALGLDEQEVLLLLQGVATLDRKRRM